MLNVIRKKPKANAPAGGAAAAGDQGYGATANKRDAQGMIIDQQHAQAAPQDFGAANRASAAATKQTNNLNRGSEFKKTAQQMLNK